jgi:hypothetical protein
MTCVCTAWTHLDRTEMADLGTFLARWLTSACALPRARSSLQTGGLP